MNSQYLFVTIHGHGVLIEEVEKTLKEKYPDCEITVSDEKFENER